MNFTLLTSVTHLIMFKLSRSVYILAARNMSNRISSFILATLFLDMEKKRKQVEITLDDLHEMYMRYKRGTEIVLWMKQTASRKRSRTPKSGQTDSRKHSRTPTEHECSTSTGCKPGRSNYDKRIEKMSAVDRICDEL